MHSRASRTALHQLPKFRSVSVVLSCDKTCREDGEVLDTTLMVELLVATRVQSDVRPSDPHSENLHEAIYEN